MPTEMAEGTEYRRHRESSWIKELKCNYPFVLNYYPLVHDDKNWYHLLFFLADHVIRMA